MKIMNEIFMERVISKNLRPPCSPDLTPPDFYLWEQQNLQRIVMTLARLIRVKNCNNCVHKKHPQADLRKVFANEIKLVHACIDACVHHCQHLSQVHSDFPNADLQKVFGNKINQVQACIDTHGYHFQHLL
jgi:hypothetical protein